MIASLGDTLLCVSSRQYVASALGAGGDVIGVPVDVGDVLGDTGSGAITLEHGTDTLGSGGNPDGSTSTVACCFSMWLMKMLASCWRIARLLSLIGAIAEAGDGFLRTMKRSVAMAMDL